jgi:hypothetical protein
LFNSPYALLRGGFSEISTLQGAVSISLAPSDPRHQRPALGPAVPDDDEVNTQATGGVCDLIDRFTAGQMPRAFIATVAQNFDAFVEHTLKALGLIGEVGRISHHHFVQNGRWQRLYDRDQVYFGLDQCRNVRALEQCGPSRLGSVVCEQNLPVHGLPSDAVGTGESGVVCISC